MLGCLVHSILDGGRPEHILHDLVFRSSESSRTTRCGLDTLSLPLCRTEFRCNSFVFRAAAVWNSFPSSLAGDASVSRDRFKSELFDFLFEKSA